MCVLTLLVGRFPEYPLIVAANRDESYARNAFPPRELEPGIVGGQDGQSGGTWLGINKFGMFCAVTNRETPVTTPEGLSRGLLTLEALRCQKLK